MAHATGISLVELVSTLAIVLLMGSLVAPAFRDQLMTARMTAQVNGLVHGAHLARAEALRRGRDVVLCPSADGRQCGPAATWGNGFLVFVNLDRDSPPRVDPGEAILHTGAAFRSGSIAANRNAFVFRPPGRRSVNGTITVCDRRGPAAARAVIVSYTGRPRTAPAATADGSPRCPT